MSKDPSVGPLVLVLMRRCIRLLGGEIDLELAAWLDLFQEKIKLKLNILIKDNITLKLRIDQKLKTLR